MKTGLPALICVLGLVAVSTITAQSSAGWLRYPSISPDGRTVVSTYKGDLYKVAAAGGTAIPLTAHQAHHFMPVWGRDGKQIAFASDRYGNETRHRPAEGGRRDCRRSQGQPRARDPGDQRGSRNGGRAEREGNRVRRPRRRLRHECRGRRHQARHDNAGGGARRGLLA